MELEKIRNLGAQELKHEEQQAAEQLFRLRFQMRLGHTEGVKKLRGLKKDIARIKTIVREREMGLNTALHSQHSESATGEEVKQKPAVKRTTAKAKRAKKPATRRVAPKKPAKKAVAKKKVAKKTAKKKEAR